MTGTLPPTSAGSPSDRPDHAAGATLRRLLERRQTFAVCVELVTSRGVIAERAGRRVLALARDLAACPRIHALSITDNPGGNAMLGADTLGTDLIARGQEVIIHLSCKDWNRNALQSRGWELASAGFNNVLALTGDCPRGGYHGQADAVFDIDSVALLQMFTDMNAGMVVSGPGDRPSRLKPTDFLCGAVVNNHKLQEREVIPQYLKLARKVDHGARFIINQLGYDSRKQSELLRYMARAGLDVPVLANVYVLSRTAARFFNAGAMAGCVVSDALYELVRRQAASPDRGRAFFLEFAARQVAIARGLGFAGVYLGGHIGFEEYVRILDIADGFAPDDWRDFARRIQYSRPGEFHYFEADPDTALASQRVSRDHLTSLTPDARMSARRFVPLGYRLSRLMHDKVFDPAATGFDVCRRLWRRLDRARPVVRRAAHALEQAIKIPLFDCRDCGDCSLPEIAYLCPESQCAKNQRNGPCGGTRDGLCEVGEKTCIWALAYDRLKPYGAEQRMLEGPLIVRDGALRGTSAWANTFLGRDHCAEGTEARRHEGTKEGKDGTEGEGS